jgi:hypothetical protein
LQLVLPSAVPRRFGAKLLVFAAVGVGAVAHGPPAFAGGEPDPWRAAATRVSYSLYRPALTLGFTLARVRFDPCGNSGNSLVDGLYTRGSRTRGASFALTEEFPEPCGDPGESMAVTTVDVNGERVDVNVFCYSPGPRCTVADGFANGYLLFLRPAGPSGTQVVVTSRRVALGDLLKIVRSLAKVPKAAAAPAPATSAASPCSMAEATRVVRRLHLGNADDPDVANPVAQVLCGAFVGPGSQAMVASLSIPTCGRTAGWVVFRRTGATWQLVMERNNGADLDAAGTGIRETMFVLRPGDAHCFPTGGTRSRIWRWNGTRFTASPWTRSKPATPKTPSSGLPLPSGYLKTPSGNIACIYWLGAAPPTIGCRIKSGLVPEPRTDRPGCPPDGRRAPPGDREAVDRRPLDLHGRARGRRRALRIRVERTGAGVRHDLVGRWTALLVGERRADLPQQERPRLLPEP